MDIAVITSSGQISITRGVSLTSLGVGNAQYAPAAFGSADVIDVLVGILHAGGVVLKAAGCGAAIASGVGIPLAIACAAQSVNGLRGLLSKKEIDESKDAIGLIGTLGQCAQDILHGTGIDIFDCLARLRKVYLGQADSYRQAHQADIDIAVTQLRTVTPPPPTITANPGSVSMTCMPYPSYCAVFQNITITSSTSWTSSTPGFGSLQPGFVVSPDFGSAGSTTVAISYKSQFASYNNGFIRFRTTKSGVYVEVPVILIVK